MNLNPKLVKVPLRVTIAPSGGDNPFWCKQNEGNSYCLTINKYIYTLVIESPVNEYKLAYHQLENVFDSEDIQHRILYNIFNHRAFRGKYYSLLTWSDLPSRSGLGSSAAFTLSVLKALNCKKQGIELALTAYRFENNYNVIGPQDFLACELQGLNHFCFKYNKNWNIKVYQEDINDWFLYLFNPFKYNIGRLAGNILEKIKDDYNWRRDCEYWGHCAFDYYKCNDYENYKKYINEYTIECKYKKLIPQEIWRSIARFLNKYAIKKVGAGGKGFFLIISEKELEFAKKNPQFIKIEGVEKKNENL